MLGHRLCQPPSVGELKSIIEAKGFVIIMYKRCNNSEEVAELIEKLHIQKEIEERDSFLYISKNLRFVFLNSDIKEEDKRALLCHELGHILDPDLVNYNVYSCGVKCEEFANEFSYHLKHPGFGFSLCALVNQKRILSVCVAGVLLCAAILFSVVCNNGKAVKNFYSPDINVPQEDKYYVTSGGEKYHRGSCVIIKNRTNITEVTIDDAIKSGYDSCELCIGQ